MRGGRLGQETTRRVRKTPRPRTTDLALGRPAWRRRIRYTPGVDRIAEVYFGRAGDARSQTLARQRVDWIVTQIEVGPVLEVGCSQGIVSVLTAEKGLDVTGVDIEPSLIEAARDLASSRLGPKAGRIDLRFGDAYELPFADNSFATVAFGEIIEHLEEPERALDELYRVLQPGGRMVLTTPLGFMYDPEHVQVFLPETLGEMLSRSFVVDTMTTIDHYLAVLAQAANPRPGSIAPEVIAQCWASAGTVLVDCQERLHDSKREVARITTRVREVIGQRDDLQARLKSCSERVEQLKRLEKSRLAPYELRARSVLGRLRGRLKRR